MRGTPVGVICFEIMLSDNGLRLSPQLCQLLDRLTTNVGVALVVDEILTCGRVCASLTILLCDQVGIQPDFIVIGCGIVLRESKGKKDWRVGPRRYPTTNCSIDQALLVQKCLESFLRYLKDNENVYTAVENTIRRRCPEVIGKGLIWILNVIDQEAVPAAAGAERVPVKLIPLKNRRVL